MNNLYEIQGFYGASKNEATIYVYEERNGSKWYCVEDGFNLNCTYDEIKDGCNVEELQDFDTMTSINEIKSLDEFYDYLKN